MSEIILASSSPRRKQLLSQIVNDFKIIPSYVDESFPSSLDPFKVSLYVSNLKANDIHLKYPSDIVIGADTTVILDNKIFGKPKTKTEAKLMLKQLSNRFHYVVSAVTVYLNDEKYEINSINKIYFKELSDEEIDDYLNYDEYKDKAGAYAIQGIAKKFILKYEGEFESIVGLPIKPLKALLTKIKK